MNPSEKKNDLTPYYYATPPINVDDLRIRIRVEVNILKKNPDLMKKVMRSMRKRAKVCSFQ